MELLKLLIVLLSIHAPAILSINVPESKPRTGLEYMIGSHLDLSYEAIQELAARASGPTTDPVFQPPDWTNSGNMISDNGPMLRSNWGTYHCIAKDRTSAGFYQALLLAQAALRYLDTTPDTPGPSFERYFAGQSVADVRVVFSQLFNPNYQAGDSLLAIPNWKFLFMDIRYGPPLGQSEGQYDDLCLPGNPELAVLNQGEKIAPGVMTDYRRALMILCPRVFNQADLPLGPLDATNDARCVTMRQTPYTTLSLDTLASTILHEFMHWDFLMDPATQGNHINDYQSAYDPGNTQGDPGNGYGPYNAFRLSARQRNPTYNADSYVEFAIEVWWWYTCSPDGTLQLIDPPSNSNTLVAYATDEDGANPP